MTSQTLLNANDISYLSVHVPTEIRLRTTRCGGQELALAMS